MNLQPGWIRKEEMRFWGTISALHRERGMTIILVSHSMEDMARYAQRLIVMNHGEKILR